MALLPPSTNAAYRGSIHLAPWFLAVSALPTIVPGLIHYFLPDGGAGVIAHMGLTTRAERHHRAFRLVRVLQIPFGISS